jgi:hypothetical protein
MSFVQRPGMENETHDNLIFFVFKIVHFSKRTKKMGWRATGKGSAQKVCELRVEIWELRVERCVKQMENHGVTHKQAHKNFSSDPLIQYNTSYSTIQ